MSRGRIEIARQTTLVGGGTGEVIELITYVAGVELPVLLTVTKAGSELAAATACPSATLPSDSRLEAKPATVLPRLAREGFSCRMSESLFCRIWTGIPAICTARLRTFCKSLEYLLTPFNVSAVKGEVLMSAQGIASP
jgi:hypothetical protein